MIDCVIVLSSLVLTLYWFGVGIISCVKELNDLLRFCDPVLWKHLVSLFTTLVYYVSSSYQIYKHDTLKGKKPS